MNGQFSIFEGSEKLAFEKPIRLIELFAGIGAQAAALGKLGVPFEHYRAIEVDKYAMEAYNAIHGTTFETSDIKLTRGGDLGVTDTAHFQYILTYSFPCQDLSVAGSQRGMRKGSGTRSGLLWEVERLITEMDELPQILLMENVPQVHNDKNIESFKSWIAFLDSMGYKSRYKDLNGKNYGVPQNRERCFMVSWLGDYYYHFPEPRNVDVKLKDVLDESVDEKYYLNEKQIRSIMESNFNTNRARIQDVSGVSATLCARDWKDPKCVEVSGSE